MAHHVHILKALERIGQYVAHRLFIRVISLCEDTVMFFDDLSARSPVFVKRSEICDDIVDFHPSLLVRILQNCFEQNGLIRVAHIHIFDHFHKQVFTVLIVDQRPPVFFGVAFQRFFFEILEHPMFAHRHDQIGNQFSFANIPFNRLRLHVHAPNKLHLTDHARRLFLPIKDVDRLIIGCIDRIINDSIRAFPFCIEIILGFPLPLFA